MATNTKLADDIKALTKQLKTKLDELPDGQRKAMAAAGLEQVENNAVQSAIYGND